MEYHSADSEQAIENISYSNVSMDISLLIECKESHSETTLTFNTDYPSLSNTNQPDLVTEQNAASQSLRRSSRNLDMSLLDRRDVKQLLRKIKRNHSDTVVLKLKDHITIDITPAVMDEIIASLKSNRVCQALYIQNLNRAVGDKQILKLLELLKRKLIWCLNIGENYCVSTTMWEFFCNTLPSTNITHLYVSEHVISLPLKNLMRFHIRANRKKHNKHSTLKNFRVIERCTHMWWNPINSIRLELEAINCHKRRVQKRRRTKEDKAAVQFEEELTVDNSLFRAENQLDPCPVDTEKPPPIPWSNEKWKFACVCKESCSYYENRRFHPIGPMFECTRCLIWAHIECNFGFRPQEELEEIPEVLCHKCRCKVRRERLRELRELNLVWVDGLAQSLSSSPRDQRGEFEGLCTESVQEGSTDRLEGEDDELSVMDGEGEEGEGSRWDDDSLWGAAPMVGEDPSSLVGEEWEAFESGRLAAVDEAAPHDADDDVGFLQVLAGVAASLSRDDLSSDKNQIRNGADSQGFNGSLSGFEQLPLTMHLSAATAGVSQRHGGSHSSLRATKESCADGVALPDVEAGQRRGGSASETATRTTTSAEDNELLSSHGSRSLDNGLDTAQNLLTMPEQAEMIIHNDQQGLHQLQPSSRPCASPHSGRVSEQYRPSEENWVVDTRESSEEAFYRGCTGRGCEGVSVPPLGCDAQTALSTSSIGPKGDCGHSSMLFIPIAPTADTSFRETDVIGFTSTVPANTDLEYRVEIEKYSKGQASDPFETLNETEDVHEHCWV